MKIAKAVAATVAPWVAQAAGAVGFVEVSQSGAEAAVLSVILALTVYFVPNKG